MRYFVALSVYVFAWMLQPMAAGQQRKSLYPFTPDGRKWGYVDQSGKVIIEPQFEAALPFSEGLAAVKEKGKYGYIDFAGSMKIAPQFERAKSFSEGIAPVLNGDSWVFLAKDGRIVLEGYKEAGPFVENLAPVKIGEKYGYINRLGKQVIEPRFDESYAFKDGLAPISVHGKYGFVDTTGKLVVSPSFDRVLEFSEGKAAVDQNGKWGYIEADGHLVIGARFDSAGSFQRGKAVVVTGGRTAQVSSRGSVTATATPTTPLFSYRVESEPSHARIFVVPLWRWNTINQHPLTEFSLREFDRGETDADLDLFDQKYMIVLSFHGVWSKY